MKPMQFESKFSEQLVRYVNHKIAEGHPADHHQTMARLFDKWCLRNAPDDGTLTREIAWNFFLSAKELSSQYQHMRASFVRQFGKYLNLHGVAAYCLPPRTEPGVTHKPPYILSEAEIIRFFDAVHSLMLKHSGLKCLRLSLSTLFFLMLSLGLRPGEARLLHCNDIDLNTGKVVIRPSKHWESRLVVMSEHTLEQCQIYDRLVGQLCAPDRVPFFVNCSRTFISSRMMLFWFQRFWDHAKLPRPESFRCSPYCFRHTFAVMRLNRWSREGVNLNEKLDRLSLFMGHVNILSTAYYLHLEDSYYDELKKRMSSSNRAILPKVVTHEKE